MATDQGGKRGPQSSRLVHDRFRRPERGMDNHSSAVGGMGVPGGNADRDPSNANNPGVPPAVPGFGFSFPGMPMFPPGFMMGGAQPGTSAQPPPPGQGS
jgi:protein NRD1